MPPASTARLGRQIAFGRHSGFTKVNLVVDHPRHQYVPSRIDHRRIVGGTDRRPNAFDSTARHEQVAFFRTAPRWPIGHW